MQDFGLSPSMMGILLSAFFWTYGAFQIPAGLVVDRFGIRRSYLFAFLLWSLASAAISLSRHAHDVLFLRLLLGMAESVGPIASLTFIRQSFSERERGLPVSIYIAGQNLGPACGALVGTALLAKIGWRGMFAITGLTALLWLPFWILFAPPATRVLEKGQGSAPASFESFRRFLATSAFGMLAVCVFLYSYYWYFFLTWIPTYLTTSGGFSVLAMGRILSMPLAIMAVLNIAVGRFADVAISRGKNALRVRVRLAGLGFLGASSIFALNYISGTAPVLALLTISICSFGIASTNFWAVAQQVSPVSMTARAIASLNTLSQAAGALAPIITGYTLGPHKNFSASIELAALCVLGAGLLLVIPGVRPFTNLHVELS